MRGLGYLFAFLALYGFFSSYRILVHKELFWAYPSLYYRRKAGYSQKLCVIVGVFTLPFDILIAFLAYCILTA